MVLNDHKSYIVSNGQRLLVKFIYPIIAKFCDNILLCYLTALADFSLLFADRISCVLPFSFIDRLIL